MLRVSSTTPTRSRAFVGAVLRLAALDARRRCARFTMLPSRCVRPMPSSTATARRCHDARFEVDRREHHADPRRRRRSVGGAERSFSTPFRVHHARRSGRRAASAATPRPSPASSSPRARRRRGATSIARDRRRPAPDHVDGPGSTSRSPSSRIAAKCAPRAIATTSCTVLEQRRRLPADRARAEHDDVASVAPAFAASMYAGFSPPPCTSTSAPLT